MRLISFLICRIKDHNWVYEYLTYTGESFRDYWERWQVRYCLRCKKRQERKLFDTRDGMTAAQGEK